MTLIRLILAFVFRQVLALRYRVRITGLDALPEKLRGALILPAHPAYTDPVLVMLHLYPRLRMRPMLAERMFKSPFLFWLPWLMRGIKIPVLEQASIQAKKRAKQAVEDTVTMLERGDNVGMWPAGRIWEQPGENLGAARAAHDLLERLPDAPVLLIRTRGLYGSRFSFAFRARKPSLMGELARSIGWMIASVFFFMPRRRVEIHIEPLDRDDLPQPLTRDALNRYLDGWYNAHGQEDPTYVPYHLLGSREHTYPVPRSVTRVKPTQITPATQTLVDHVLRNHPHGQDLPAELSPTRKLEDMGFDSLDRMELTLSVEQASGFSSELVPTTVLDLWALAQGLADTAPPKPPPPAWFASSAEQDLRVLGETVIESFLKRARKARKHLIVADDTSGVLSYERLTVGVRLMAKEIKRLPAERVGVMLPATVAADLCVLSVLMAGKVPVMLNWTTGPSNLDHAIRLTGLTHVLTSKVFVDRVGIALPGVEVWHLEEVRKRFGTGAKLRALLGTRWFFASLLASAPRPDVDDPAVILFTSGSEKAPKAVPLSHRNLLSNMRDVLQGLSLPADSSMLSFLPPFHSFGLAITMLLPLLSGIRVAHHPDPTDAGSLVRKVADYKLNMLLGTPTFLSYILERATGDELHSLHLAVVGAEKCPEAVFQRCAEVAPHAEVLEGYGITECAPVVSVNFPGRVKPGSIGEPLAGITLRFMHPDTKELLPAEAREGMLLIRGENVFAGYMGEGVEDPFVTDEAGHRYYNSGDLVSIDDDGYLHFRGRLKRFLKAGGEMISLPALEEPFAVRFPADDQGPRVAVEGIEIPPASRRIVLFTRESLTLSEANIILSEAGFSGVMRLDDVVEIETIPVLGTGKTDYKILRGRLQGTAEASSA